MTSFKKGRRRRRVEREHLRPAGATVELGMFESTVTEKTAGDTRGAVGLLCLLRSSVKKYVACLKSGIDISHSFLATFTGVGMVGCSEWWTARVVDLQFISVTPCRRCYKTGVVTVKPLVIYDSTSIFISLILFRIFCARSRRRDLSFLFCF